MNLAARQTPRPDPPVGVLPPPGPRLVASPSAIGVRYAAPLDAAERERLLQEQLPQVRFVARRIHERLPAHVDIEDLVQAGVLGLIDAINRYDPAHNAQLATYARFRIHGAILDSLRALDSGSRQLRRRARELAAAEQEQRQKLGRAPNETELAASIGIDLEELRRLRTELEQLESGNAPSGDDEDATPDLEMLPSSAPDPYALQRRSEVKELLGGVIAELPERERQILSLYYYEELTMKEVGAVLGIGESRVSQLHSQILANLRRRMRGQKQLQYADLAE